MEMERRRSEEIQADVSSQLFWDDRIDNSDIQVAVKDGRVRLSGTVPSYSDKWEAEDDAYAIPGVRIVENQLMVTPAISPVPEDSDVGQRVENVLDWNPLIDASGMTVSVTSGIVTLSGIVESFWQRYKAWELSSNVSGVVDVVNDLQVSPPESVSDEDIRDDILNALDRSYIDASDLDVAVQDCIVTLKGRVNTFGDFRTAEQIASHTAGVCGVRNDLAIV
jgi:osmotically-inducible protein OsmY